MSMPCSWDGSFFRILVGSFNLQSWRDLVILGQTLELTILEQQAELYVMSYHHAKQVAWYVKGSCIWQMSEMWLHCIVCSLLCFIDHRVILYVAILTLRSWEMGLFPLWFWVVLPGTSWAAAALLPKEPSIRGRREKRLPTDLAGVSCSVPSARGMAWGQVRDGWGLFCFLNLVRTLIPFHVVQGIQESLFQEVQLWCWVGSNSFRGHTSIFIVGAVPALS